MLSPWRRFGPFPSASVGNLRFLTRPCRLRLLPFDLLLRRKCYRVAQPWWRDELKKDKTWQVERAAAAPPFSPAQQNVLISSLRRFARFQAAKNEVEAFNSRRPAWFFTFSVIRKVLAKVSYKRAPIQPRWVTMGTNRNKILSSHPNDPHSTVEKKTRNAK